MRLLSYVISAFLIATTAVTTGCTSKSNTQTVSITFPDWNALQQKSYAHQSSKSSPFVQSTSVAQVQMISINASGAGVSEPVVFSWRRQQEADSAPMSATFTVPQGSLIQAVALIEGAGSGSTAIYYGDAVVANQEHQDLSIDLTNVAATQAQGNVSGRYLTAANSGPTGAFQYRFAPSELLGGNRPTMIVSTGEIFSGWMSAFAMGGGLIKHTWIDGTTAFIADAKNTDLLSPAASHPSRSVRVRIPAGYENQSRQMGQYYMTKRGEEFLTFGYFGPFADQNASLRVCVADVISDATGIYIDGIYQTASDTDPTLAPSDQFKWFAQYATPTLPGAKISGAADLGAGFTVGGSKAASCNVAGSVYNDYLMLDGSQLAHHDNVLGFRGPFAKKTATEYLKATYVSGSSAVTLDWTLLPGVANEIGGVMIFYRSVPGFASYDDLKHEDGYDCAKFAKPDAYAIPFSKILVGTGATNTSITGVSSFAQAGNLQIIACPRAKDGTYFESAIRPEQITSVNAALEISDGPSFDFGTTPTTVGSDKTFTITNVGNAVASGVSDTSSFGTSFTYKGGSYPGTGGSCGTTILAGANCQVVVQFAPSSSGSKTGLLRFNYNDGSSPQSSSRVVQGFGAVPAALNFITSDYNYGSVEEGLSLANSFTISNTGGFPATAINISGIGATFQYVGAGFPGTGGTCTSTLSPGAQCTIVLRATPSVPSNIDGTLTLTWTTPGATSLQTQLTTHVTGTVPAQVTSLARLLPAAALATDSSITLRANGVIPNDVVKIYTDATCSTQTGSPSVVPPGQSRVDVTLSIVTDGAFQFYATRENSAGFGSLCSAVSAMYTRDTTPPTIAIVYLLSPSTNPGFISNPTLRITGTFVNDTIQVFTSSATCAAGSPVFSTSGIVSSSPIDMTMPTIAQGSYEFYVAAKDGLGNRTACTPQIPYIFDATYASVSFGNYTEQVTEGMIVTIPITISPPKPYAVTVRYVANGSAVAAPAGVGALGSSGSVTIPANAGGASISFTATSNSGDQGNRNVDIALYDTDYPYVNAAGIVSHRVSIVDNSTAGTLPYQLPMGYAAGNFGSCYIDTLKKLWCLGRGNYGVVGDGTNVDREVYVPVAPTEYFSKVVNGLEHVCALTMAGGSSFPVAGTVVCWGLNTTGQLGDNTTTSHNAPAQVYGTMTGAKDIAAGGNSTCAIKSDNTLWCWGSNSNGQAKLVSSGGSNQLQPIQIDSGFTYQSVSVGAGHVCAIRQTNSRIYCFGRNNEGEGGNGVASGNITGSVYDVDSTTAYQQVSVGEYHSCGLIAASDGTYPNRIKCWGYSNYGQLGRNNSASSGIPTLVDTTNQYVKISAGKEQTCGITAATNSPASALRCTGRGDIGTMLDRVGANGNSLVFATSQPGKSFSAVSTGYQSTWATTSTNDVLFGGYESSFASSGDSKTTLAKFGTEASNMDSVSTYQSLDTGSGNERATCGIVNNKIRCVGGAGDNAFGLFGIGSSPDMTGFIWIDPKNNYSSVSTGRYHMCAIRTDGHLFCAGVTPYLGASSSSSVLVAIDSSNTYLSVQSGINHSCAILTSGQVKCWGPNSSGQLGDGGVSTRLTPVPADGGNTYSQIAVGEAHTCGIQSGASAGRVRCWGSYLNGRLGNSAVSSNQLTGSDISDVSIYASVAAGGQHTCGILSSGLMKCWGDNSSGQVGDGTGTGTKPDPVAVAGGVGFLSVAAGDLNTCGVNASGGNMYCWGSNVYGISGSLSGNAGAPQILDNGFQYSYVTMGRTKVCGLTVTGGVRCWGDSRYNAWGDFTRMWAPEALNAVGFIR